MRTVCNVTAENLGRKGRFKVAVFHSSNKIYLLDTTSGNRMLKSHTFLKLQHLVLQSMMSTL